MNCRELLIQSLDALEKPLLEGRLTPACIQKNQEAIAALKVELAKPEPEPVAWMHPTSHDCISAHRQVYTNGIPLYRMEDV
jgi:hypothetical protein